MTSPPETKVPTIQDMVRDAVEAAFDARLGDAPDAVRVVADIRDLLGLKPGDDVLAAVKDLRDNATMRQQLLQTHDNRLRKATTERDEAVAELHRVVGAVEGFGARRGITVEAAA